MEINYEERLKAIKLNENEYALVNRIVDSLNKVFEHNIGFKKLETIKGGSLANKVGIRDPENNKLVSDVDFVVVMERDFFNDKDGKNYLQRTKKLIEDNFQDSQEVEIKRIAVSFKHKGIGIDVLPCMKCNQKELEEKGKGKQIFEPSKILNQLFKYYIDDNEDLKHFYKMVRLLKDWKHKAGWEIASFHLMLLVLESRVYTKSKNLEKSMTKFISWLQTVDNGTYKHHMRDIGDKSKKYVIEFKEIVDSLPKYGNPPKWW